MHGETVKFISRNLVEISWRPVIIRKAVWSRESREQPRAFAFRKGETAELGSGNEKKYFTEKKHRCIYLVFRQTQHSYSVGEYW